MPPHYALCVTGITPDHLWIHTTGIQNPNTFHRGVWPYLVRAYSCKQAQASLYQRYEGSFTFEKYSWEGYHVGLGAENLLIKWYCPRIASCCIIDNFLSPLLLRRVWALVYCVIAPVISYKLAPPTLYRTKNCHSSDWWPSWGWSDAIITQSMQRLWKEVNNKLTLIQERSLWVELLQFWSWAACMDLDWLIEDF